MKYEREECTDVLESEVRKGVCSTFEEEDDEHERAVKENDLSE